MGLSESAGRASMGSMRFLRFRISNHKCFEESQEIQLGPTLNVIVGRNNSGKTALLEALSLGFAARPHRSLRTLSRRDTPPRPASTVDFTVAVTLDDLRGTNQVFLPAPDLGSEFAASIGYTDHSPDSQKRFSDWYVARPEHHFRICLSRTGQQDGWAPTDELDYPFLTDQRVGHYVLQVLSDAPSLTYAIGPRPMPSIQPVIGPRVKERVLVLLPPGMTGHSFVPNVPSSTVAPDAANLGPLLLELQKRTFAMARFKEQVREVAPEVKDITIDPQGSVPLIWLYGQDTERDDLAVPLPECGQGLKYILAIVYILFAETTSRIILIDEIQGLLHPGALRKLFEKFRNQNRHQFIITSNSPMVVTGAHPDAVVVVRRSEHGSSLTVLTAESVADQRALLLELGASLSDVFGADGVVWVEGPTEAECFELILSKHNIPSRGIVFLPVRATGDFEGEAADLVCDIYRRLTAVAGLVPTKLAFVFDDEGRSKARKDEIGRQLNAGAHFLPRRMYENYLLNAGAIASYLKTFSIETDEEEIGRHLDEAITNKTDRRLYPQARLGEPRECLHAANLIEETIAHFGRAKLAYKGNKRAVALYLTKWLLEHEPQTLEPVAAFLRPILEELRLTQ